MVKYLGFKISVLINFIFVVVSYFINFGKEEGIAKERPI